jgi:hypothetical protein
MSQVVEHQPGKPEDLNPNPNINKKIQLELGRVETNFNTSSWKGQAIGSLARAAQATL